MTRPSLTAVALSLSLSLTVALAATRTVSGGPEPYRIEFENAWVRVTRVVYGPNAVIAPHRHTDLASAYVYLNDGPAILFKHEGLPYAGVTRPATRAGSFRVYKGLAEVHSVENPTTVPSQFLRVEFKTEPREDAALKGKFFRDEPPPAVTTQQTQFENAQVSITRIRVVPRGSVSLAAGAQRPALLVALVPTGVLLEGAADRVVEAGATVWLDPARAASIRAVGDVGEVLRFDFKTTPTAGSIHR